MADVAPASVKDAIVAAVQAEPAWLDLDASIDRTIELLKEAASKGASLVAFPELWIPGYPFFLWVKDFGATMPLTLKYMKNSLEVQSHHMERLKAACREAGIWISFGFAEKRNASLYMSNAIINADGEIVMSRRKMKPTGVERVLFGEGSGDTLSNVVDSPFGKIGNLQCWEHIQPLLKFHTYAQNERIHVASWPACFPAAGFEHWGLSREGVTAVSRTYAIESGSFTVVASQIVTRENAAKVGLEYEGTQEARIKSGVFMAPPGGGCTAIYGPDGSLLTEEIAGDAQTILYAKVTEDQTHLAKLLADCVGHYSRPDLLRLVLTDTDRKVFEHSDDA